MNKLIVMMIKNFSSSTEDILHWNSQTISTMKWDQLNEYMWKGPIIKQCVVHSNSSLNQVNANGNR